MRIALLQLDPTVGAVEANVTSLLAAAQEARRQGASLAITGELAVTGYPPRDLLERPALLLAVRDAHARLVANVPAGLALFVGTILERTGSTGKALANAVLVLERGRILATAIKQLLPSYDVFDEERHFEAGTETLVVPTVAGLVAVTICEDAWWGGLDDTLPSRYAHDPLAAVAKAKVDLMVNLSASPFTLPKRQGRPELFSGIARRLGVPVAFVNQAGANDELLFDGRSTLYDQDGQVCARAPAFAAATVVVDFPPSAAPALISPDLESDEEATYHGLVAGIRGYMKKCGFSRAVLGLSGGIDSALVATLAADALGPDHVLGVALPSRYSSDGSKRDAEELARRLGVDFRMVSIEPLVTAYEQTLGPILNDLAPAPADDVTWENVQSRVRGATLMAVSNRTGALLLTTGNKSELAVGYATLYGDMCGGLAVLGDVPKTLVWRLARWINHHRGNRIPEASIVKAPSAELRPGQQDEDTLPPYDVLDAILKRHIEEGDDRAALLTAGFATDLVDHVLALVRWSEFKRRQAAPTLLLTKKGFGMGRRIPVARGGTS